MSSAPAPSDSGGLSRILKDVTGFVGSQYFIRFAMLLKGFVVARLLGPTGNGLWQVVGEKSTTFAQMVRLDLEYVDQRSLWLDAKISLWTVPTLLRRLGNGHRC